MGRSTKIVGAKLKGVRKMYMNGKTYAEIAEHYGVNIKTIFNVIKDNRWDEARKDIVVKSKDIAVEEFTKTFKLQMKEQMRELAPAVNDFIGMLGKSIKSINEQFENDPVNAEKRFRALGGVKALESIISLIGKTENEFEQKVVHRLEVPDNYEELETHDLERILNGENIEDVEYDIVDDDE